jgi:thioredoxin
MSGEPITLTDSNLDQVLSSDRPLVILATNGEGLKGDFKAAFNRQAAEASKHDFIVLDPTRNPKAAALFNLSTDENARPVLIGWYCGEEIARRPRPWSEDLTLTIESLNAAVASRNPAPEAEKAEEEPVNAPKPKVTYDKPINATDATFEQEVLFAEENLPIVIDFWAAWCGPCRMVAPILEKLAKEFAGQVKVVKVDVDANPGLSQAFGIQSIPTLMVIKNRTMLYNQPGALPEAALRQLFQKAIEIEVPMPPAQPQQ